MVARLLLLREQCNLGNHFVLRLRDVFLSQKARLLLCFLQFVDDRVERLFNAHTACGVLVCLVQVQRHLLVELNQLLDAFSQLIAAQQHFQREDRCRNPAI